MTDSEAEKNTNGKPEPETPQKKKRAVRVSRLTPEERSEIARAAVETRWSRSLNRSPLPQATHTGKLIIAGREIACAVLETRKRVLTQESFLTAIGRAAKAPAAKSETEQVESLPPFLAAANLNPFITDELRMATTPIVYKALDGKRANGFDAALLPAVCEVYLTARDAKVILPNQRHVVRTCDLLIRGLARVGIIALVDEATGYQEDRARNELHKILESYIAPELMPWTRVFPDEFFRQIYRLQGWRYKPGTARHTPYVGKLINEYVYERLPGGVLAELRRLNPVTEAGYRRHRHHQFLTALTGNPHLDKQIAIVTTLMRISGDKESFKVNFEASLPDELALEAQRPPLVIPVDEDVTISPDAPEAETASS